MVTIEGTVVVEGMLGVEKELIETVGKPGKEPKLRNSKKQHIKEKDRSKLRKWKEQMAKHKSPEEKLKRMAKSGQGTVGTKPPPCEDGLNVSGSLTAGVEIQLGVGVKCTAVIGKMKNWDFSWAIDESNCKAVVGAKAVAKINAELTGNVGYSWVIPEDDVNKEKRKIRSTEPPKIRAR